MVITKLIGNQRCYVLFQCEILWLLLFGHSDKIYGKKNSDNLTVTHPYFPLASN